MTDESQGEASQPAASDARTRAVGLVGAYTIALERTRSMSASPERTQSAADTHEKAEAIVQAILAAPPVAEGGTDAERERVARWVSGLASEVLEDPGQWSADAYEILNKAESFIRSHCAAPQQPKGMDESYAKQLIGRHASALRKSFAGAGTIEERGAAIDAAEAELLRALMGTPAQPARGEPYGWAVEDPNSERGGGLWAKEDDAHGYLRAYPSPGARVVPLYAAPASPELLEGERFEGVVHAFMADCESVIVRVGSYATRVLTDDFSSQPSTRVLLSPAPVPSGTEGEGRRG